MACIELIERNLKENKPKPLILPLISKSQYNDKLHIRLILKSINYKKVNCQTTTIGFFILRKTVPSLDLNHPHIAFYFDTILMLKSYILAHL